MIGERGGTATLITKMPLLETRQQSTIAKHNRPNKMVMMVR